MIATRSRKDDLVKSKFDDSIDKPSVIHSGGTPYLTFSSGHSRYALYIVATTAIVDDPQIETDPRLPDFVKGAVWVEGRLIPVIDLASRLGFASSRSVGRRSVIITQAHIDERLIDVGVEIDHVHDVLNLGQPDQDLPPACGANLNTHFLDLMARLPGHYAMVVHVEQLLFPDELCILADLEELADELVHH